MRKTVFAAMFLIATIGWLGVAHGSDEKTPNATCAETLMLACPVNTSELMVDLEEMSAEALGLMTGKGLPKQAPSESLSKIILWDEIDRKKAAADSMATNQTTIVLKASGMRSGPNW